MVDNIANHDDTNSPLNKPQTLTHKIKNVRRRLKCIC